MPRPLITLTTDFGADSFYVAQMKAAVLAIEPDARLIDITHSIAPQQILQGAVVLADSARHFAPGTIHIAVVDPGVGTERPIIAAAIDSHIYIAPDNGLLTLVLRRSKIAQFVRVNRPEFWRSALSHTFHGRDVMAPVAAHIARGVPLQKIGEAYHAIKMLEGIDAVIEPGSIRGICWMVDSFGNLITNIHRDMILDGGNFEVWVDGKHRAELVQTYGNREPGSLVALFGSSDRLEIAEVQGSAASKLSAGHGCRVEIFWDTKE